jgi:hypothetical protein
MARIAGINVPDRQHTEIGLTAIYGIGRTRARVDLRGGGRLPLDQEGQGPDRRRTRAHSRPDLALHGRGRPASRSVDVDQAPDGPRLLPGRASPPRPAGPRPAHPHQCPHPQGPAQGRRGAEESNRQTGSEHGNQASAAAAAAHRGSARRSARTSRTASRTFTRRSTTRSSRSPTARATRCRGRRRAARASRARASPRRSPRRWPPKTAGRAAQELRHQEPRGADQGPRPGARVVGAGAQCARHQDHARSRT